MLLTAAEAFPAMEKLVLGAHHTLDISLHIFEPATRTRSKCAQSRGIRDWADLLCDAARRGVEIRLLVNDFDAIGAPEMHGKGWKRIQTLLDRRSQLTEDDASRMKILVVYPGGRLGRVLQLAVWPRVRQVAKQALDRAGRPPPPGLAKISNSKGDIRFFPPAHNYTQSYHQKFLIADQRKAVIGGLDIDERRFDSLDHHRPAQETWHDVSVEIECSAVVDMHAHFDRSWFIGLRRGYTYMEEEDLLDLGEVDPAYGQKKAVDGDAKNPGRVIFAGTIARQGWNPFAFGPVTEKADLERATLKMIGSARSFLYIETQFLRSRRIRDALVAAAANPDLHLVVLLPAAPDVVAFEGNRSDVQRYAEWLQMRVLNKLYDAYGDRFGVFSLINNIGRNERYERDALHGRSIVYVHSKVTIADDRLAIVSSANHNGRSMRWDFEAGVVIDWPEKAGELRRRLWAAHLGADFECPDAAKDPASAMQAWNQCATAWRDNPDAGRICGAVPYPMQRAKHFSKRHLFLPSNMV